MQVTIEDLATYLYKKDPDRNSPMRLQKLCYICYGFWAAMADDPLTDEDPQAWKYGPVFKNLYYRLKNGGELKGVPHLKDPIDKFVDWVYESYKNYSALYLSALTHQKDTPWEKTWDETCDKVIPFQLIAEHYKDKIDRMQAS